MKYSDSILNHNSKINHEQFERWITVEVSNKYQDKQPDKMKKVRKRIKQIEEKAFDEDIIVINEREQNESKKNILHNEYIKQIPNYKKPPFSLWSYWFSSNKSKDIDLNEYNDIVRDLP